MEMLNLARLPYYYKFNDLNKVVYDLKEVKGFYIMEQLNRPSFDMESEDNTDYLLMICVGINHKEIELYYKDKKTRDREYKKLSKIFLSKEE